MTDAVWVVASAGTAARWVAALGSATPAIALPWSRIRARADRDAVRARLAAARGALVLLTSASALVALEPGDGAGHEAACVGAHTAEAARRLGFRVAVVGDGTGADLARTLLAGPRPSRVLWLRGEAARPEAAGLLASAGVRVEAVVTYAADPDPGLAARVAGLPPPRAIVVGSPDAADALDRALAGAGREADRAAPAVAVGPTTAARLAARGFARVVAAPSPGPEGILRGLEAIRRAPPSA